MAQLLGIPVEHIELRWFEGAGGYGRNGFDHVNADAALMSQAVGRPVRVQWMRWDEHGWEPKGPAIVQDLEGAIDANGQVTAWRHHMWIPTTGRYPPDRGGAQSASRISSAPPAAAGPTSPMPIPSPMPMSPATARVGSRC